MTLKQGKAGYEVREVILHTLALEDPNQFLLDFPTAQKARAEVDRWHRANGWIGFGYHYLVMPDGRIIRGRDEVMIGAHVKEANRGTIGIAMVNIQRHDGITKFEDYFTELQRHAVRSLIADIGTRANLRTVTGHNDYAAKECPGFRVDARDWLPQPTWWQRLFQLFKGT